MPGITEERVALVTGGSRGIGRAIVESLVAGGWRVAFTWVSDEARAHGVAEALGARPFRFDLADRERPASLVREVEDALGPVFGLINNAGIRRDGLLATTSDADWDAVIDSDLGAVFRLCRAAILGLMRRRMGSIVNVASLSALHGVPGQCAYAAAKAGVLGFTRALAREAGGRGVRVNAVVPGFVATDFTRDLDAGVVAALRAHEALRAGVEPSSVAGAVAWLLSDAATSVTGQTLVVDAGASA
jgi:3-oxoacyl-[acyl-carrier protein] reductase